MMNKSCILRCSWIISEERCFVYVVLCTLHSENILDIANQPCLFWQFWKWSNHKPSLGTTGNTYGIKDLLSKEGWKLTLGRAMGRRRYLQGTEPSMKPHKGNLEKGFWCVCGP